MITELLVNDFIDGSWEKKQKIFDHFREFDLPMRTFIRTHTDDRLDNEETHYRYLIGKINECKQYEKNKDIISSLLEILNSQVTNQSEVKDIFRTINDIIDQNISNEVYSLLIFDIIPWKIEGYELYNYYSSSAVSSADFDFIYEQKYLSTLLRYINDNIKSHGDTKELASLLVLLFTKLGILVYYSRIYSKFINAENIISNTISAIMRNDYDIIDILNNIQSDKDFFNHCTKTISTNLKNVLTESTSGYQIFGNNLINKFNTIQKLIYKTRELTIDDIKEYFGDDFVPVFKLSEKALSYIKYNLDNNQCLIHNFINYDKRHLIEINEEVYVLFCNKNTENKIYGLSLSSFTDDGDEYRNILEIIIDDADYYFKVGDELNDI